MFYEEGRYDEGRGVNRGGNFVAGAGKDAYGGCEVGGRYGGGRYGGGRALGGKEHRGWTGNKMFLNANWYLNLSITSNAYMWASQNVLSVYILNVT